MSPVAGALLGGLVASGFLVVVRRAGVLRRPSLASRVSPYLPRRQRFSDVAIAVTPYETLERLLVPSLRRLAVRLDEVIGGRRGLELRLERAGQAPDVEAFRMKQAIGGAIGAAAGAGFILLRALSSPPSVVPAIVIIVVGAVAGVVVVEQSLDRAIARRKERMVTELPTIGELLALSVAAGESIGAALERVSRVGTGVLPSELSRLSGEVRTGMPLVTSLRGLSDRAAHPAVARFVDGIVVAVERGTPLAEVLRAQAADVRETGRRQLMEEAGRREIAMMVPVVFLVMPVTVLFALFPGFIGLSLTV